MSTIIDGGRSIMSDTASKMPARIWAGGDIPLRHWSEHKPRHRDDPIDTAYIRADIVEAMAGALKLISDGRPENPIGDPWSFYDDLVQIASDALSTYREASNDHVA